MQHFITSIAALVTLSSALSAQNPGILDTAVNPANGHTYHLLDNSNWTDAEAAAVALGGHLATVEDIAENTFLTSSFSTFGGTTRHLWIGYTDAAVEGTWVWASGSTSTFTNWWVAGGAPNNSTANDPAGEDFACIYPTGEWEDLHDHASSTWFPVLCGVVEVEAPGTAYCAEAVYNCPCFAVSAVDEGCPNTTGVGATLTGTGVASVSAPSFDLTATQLPDTVGLFVQGTSAIGGADGNPVGEGRLCLGPQKRYQPQSISGGTVSRSNFQTFATAGGAMNYQFWYRDPGNNCAGGGFNFSPAWNVTWLP